MSESPIQPSPPVQPPAAPAPMPKPEPTDSFYLQQSAKSLKEIADHLNFIKSVIIIFAILSLLGIAVQICAAAGLI